MKVENFLKAIEIISKQHSNEIKINHVEPNGSITPILESPTIHITKCNVATVDKLKEAGFNLSMGKNGLSVQDYGIKEK